MAIAKVIGAFYYEDGCTKSAYYWDGRWYRFGRSALLEDIARKIACDPNHFFPAPSGYEPPIDPETGIIFYVEV